MEIADVGNLHIYFLKPLHDAPPLRKEYKTMIVVLGEKVNRTVIPATPLQEIQPQKTKNKIIYFGFLISPAGDSAIVIESGRIRDI